MLILTYWKRQISLQYQQCTFTLPWISLMFCIKSTLYKSVEEKVCFPFSSWIGCSPRGSGSSAQTICDPQSTVWWLFLPASVCPICPMARQRWFLLRNASVNSATEQFDLVPIRKVMVVIHMLLLSKHLKVIQWGGKAGGGEITNCQASWSPSSSVCTTRSSSDLGVTRPILILMTITFSFAGSGGIFFTRYVVPSVLSVEVVAGVCLS